jgi:putative CocE/NonD family hydrolase
MDAYSGVLGAHDYRELIRREDLLTFDTAPLSADTEITGPIESDLFLSCDCRDFDLWMRVYDVSTDGTAWNLMSTGNEVQRVSYRGAAAQRRLIEPGQIIELRISGPATSNLFRQGHRIRVQVSGSFSPIFSRNLQTGDLEADSGRTRTATIRLHQDPLHRSRIALPVISP